MDDDPYYANIVQEKANDDNDDGSYEDDDGYNVELMRKRIMIMIMIMMLVVIVIDANVEIVNVYYFLHDTRHVLLFL